MILCQILCARYQTCSVVKICSQQYHDCQNIVKVKKTNKIINLSLVFQFVVEYFDFPSMENKQISKRLGQSTLKHSSKNYETFYD